MDPRRARGPPWGLRSLGQFDPHRGTFQPAALRAFALQLNATTGKFEFIRDSSDSTNAAEAQANSGVAPVAGTWFHLVGVDNTSTGQIEIYVDGSEDVTGAYTGNWHATGKTVIGRATSAGQPANFVNGSVSDVQIYQAALTTAQVDALNGAPVARDTAGSREGAPSERSDQAERVATPGVGGGPGAQSPSARRGKAQRLAVAAARRVSAVSASSVWVSARGLRSAGRRLSGRR